MQVIGEIHFFPQKNQERNLQRRLEKLLLHCLLRTQDFCVIAHRDQHLKSPLRDQSNSSVAKDYRNSPSAASSEKEEESDLEPEMLFTQDSEGNMVIKH